MEMEILDFDCLVVGGGIGGLMLALEIDERWKVAVITKGDRRECATWYAQGGIAAVLDQSTDSFEKHIHDTAIAGGGLCDKDAVTVCIHEGPTRLKELADKYGARFDGWFNDDDGGNTESLGREGGHCCRRVVHSGDATGREVENSLLKVVESRPNITILDNHMVLELITSEPSLPGAIRCCGANAVNQKTNGRVVLRASITVIATGGAASAFLYTSSPPVDTGDGIAMAYRAGALLANMEFIQFHPTCLWTGKQGMLSLLTEAMRGEGGVLRKADGTRVMEGVHPLEDLAPRDVVSRTMAKAMRSGGAECLYLDMTDLDEDFLKKRFPNIWAKCAEHDIDMSKDPIPVVPAAHYTCGGIVVNLWGETSVQNLFAVGECACTGLHGANRLASNSLLEGMVFGYRAGRRISHLLGAYDFDGDVMQGYVPSGHTRIINLRPHEENDENLSAIFNSIKAVMWGSVGIIRTTIGLKLAVEQLSQILRVVETGMRKNGITPRNAELRNLAQVALLIAKCALFRKESRGCHFLEDFPCRDDANWLRYTLVGMGVETHKGPLVDDWISQMSAGEAGAHGAQAMAQVGDQSAEPDDEHGGEHSGEQVNDGKNGDPEQGGDPVAQMKACDAETTL